MPAARPPLLLASPRFSYTYNPAHTGGRPRRRGPRVWRLASPGQAGTLSLLPLERASLPGRQSGRTRGRGDPRIPLPPPRLGPDELRDGGPCSAAQRCRLPELGTGRVSPLNVEPGAPPPACHQVAREQDAPRGFPGAQAGALCPSLHTPATGHSLLALRSVCNTPSVLGTDRAL